MRTSVRWGVMILAAGLALGCGDSADGDDGAGSGGDGHEHDAGDGHDAAEPSASALDDEADGPRPAAEFLPPASGPCPGFVDGELCTQDATSLICTFEPEGEPARPVRLWLPEGAADDDLESPVVFFFHGMGGQASNAVLTGGGLGAAAVEAINAEGGIVVALEKEVGRATTQTMQPWKTAVLDGSFEPEEDRFDDMTVMDEVLACAEEKLGVNSRRIHATGMSAGGLMTSNLIYRRNGYLASLAPFSGGVQGLPDEQDPSRKAPVMYSWGGESDNAVGQDFNQYAVMSLERLAMNGNFVFTCDHGAGHSLPGSLPLPMWEFFKSHPFGGDPEPYADGLPDGEFPDFCSVP